MDWGPKLNKKEEARLSLFNLPLLPDVRHNVTSPFCCSDSPTMKYYTLKLCADISHSFKLHLLGIGYTNKKNN